MRGLGLKDGLIAAVNAEIPRWKALARSVIAGRCDRQSSEPAPNPEREAPVSALTGLDRNAGETRSIRETRSVGEIGSVHPLVDHSDVRGKLSADLVAQPQSGIEIRGSRGHVAGRIGPRVGIDLDQGLKDQA